MSQTVAPTTAAPPTLVWLSVNSSHSHASLALPLLHAAHSSSTKAEGKKRDWLWQAVDATVKHRPDLIAGRVASFAPRLVAATAYLFNREPLLKMLRRVKAMQPTCSIVLGGPEFLGDNRNFLVGEPAVAAVFRGAGDLAFSRFLSVLDDPLDWPSVPGLCWLGRQGEYHDNGRAELTGGELRALPLPTGSRFYDFSRPFATIETARGCFGKCAYCASAASRSVQTLSPPQVRAMLGDLQARKVCEVRVLDRTFNSHPPRCRALLEIFAEEFPEMRFHLEIHPGFLDRETRQCLAAFPPHRLHLEAGLQTGSAPGLQKSGRPGSAEAAWEGLAFLCHLANLEVHADLIAGLPRVSLAQTLRDLDKMIELEPAEIQLETLKLLPGTPLREQAANHGLAFAPDPPYEILRGDCISPEELLIAQQVSRFVDDFYNQPQLRRATRMATTIKGAGFFEFMAGELAGERGDCPPRSLTSRFRLFHRIAARDPELRRVRAELEYQWLVGGHSPEHGIRPSVWWKGEPPDDATLHQGKPPKDFRDRVRVRQARIAEFDYWFVFAGAAREAVAVYRRPAGRADSAIRPMQA